MDRNNNLWIGELLFAEEHCLVDRSTNSNSNNCNSILSLRGTSYNTWIGAVTCGYEH